MLNITEELFRFASTRAPSAVAQPEGMLELADDSAVPAWLAAANEQDFAAQIDALDTRWRALTGRHANVCADLLIGSNAAEPQASTALFPFAPEQDCGATLDALLTDLWQFYLQGISSGKADGAQLKRAQQLMGQAALLQSVAATKAGKVEPAQLAAALNPKVRLPAAFEQHMRAWRGHDTGLQADPHAQQRSSLAARLAQLQALELGLAAAIERAGPSDTPPPYALPVPNATPDAAERRYRFQPAADLGQRFRLANDALMHELDEAQVGNAGQSPYQLLDEVRRQMAAVVLAAARLPLPVLAPAGARLGIRPVGVADLRVVRQTLLGYEKGALAHIDNMVDGESRELRHTELQRTEEGLSDYAERYAEQYREQQDSERLDMGRFAYQAARESQDSNSSVTISGTMGDVTVQSSTFMGASRGRDETAGEDQRRSREIVERALQITSERVGQYRWRNAIAEVTETSIHKQKAHCGHLVAQYRWVDKVYQAQVYNIGARAMYEAMVPAPAALLTQLLAREPGLSAHAGPAPARPALQASDITDTSWTRLAALHGVTLPAPPLAAITEYAQASHPAGSTSGVFKLARALEQGYQASAAGCSMAWLGASGECGVTASVGTLMFASSAEPSSALGAQTMAARTGAVPFSTSAWGAVEQYTVNFYLVWTRTAAAVEQWQQECHRLIMEDYERKLSAHRERQAVALSPAHMRAIERTELKRAILAMVRTEAGTASPAPREVRFFEYAFDWEQMTYRFLPYFWNAQEDWSAARLGQQGDSVFQAFLGAGYASVILPVRKGFEDAAALYLQTGLILDLPVVPADPELAAMNREVALINAAGAGGVAEGEPWTYRVPTSLKVLDDGTGAQLAQLSAPRG